MSGDQGRKVKTLLYFGLFVNHRTLLDEIFQPLRNIIMITPFIIDLFGTGLYPIGNLLFSSLPLPHKTLYDQTSTQFIKQDHNMSLPPGAPWSVTYIRGGELITRGDFWLIYRQTYKHWGLITRILWYLILHRRCNVWACRWGWSCH